MSVKLFFYLLIVPFGAFAASTQALVTYLDLPDGAQSSLLAADKSGNVFVISTVTELSGRLVSRITKTDPHGTKLATMDFGSSQNDTISAAAVDPDGDLVLAGTTYPIGSPVDFPLVSPLISDVPGEAAFIVKIDSQLQNILFSTLLGGAQGAGTSANALAIDENGNIYVTGGTADSSFPVTPGAFQIVGPPIAPIPQTTYAYVTEISADDKKIVFSTFFGSDHVICAVGDCAGSGFAFGTAIALDAEGNVVIAGHTDSDQLPVTPGVYGPSCGACSDEVRTSFLAKFASGGSKLLWATYIPATLADLEIYVQAMALDSSGNVIVGGTSAGSFPVTAGALQTTYPVPGGFGVAGFVAKFDSSAQRLLFSTYFGGGTSLLNGLTLDSQGTIWITGYSTPGDLPVSKGTPLLGSTYVAGLSGDGSTLLDIFTAPDMAAGRAIIETSLGTTVALGSAASLLTLSPGSGPSLIGVANSAASFVSPAVAPEELISIYGIDIGPSIPANAQIVDGYAPLVLNGVTVSFNGIQAGLLYVGPTQINAVVPSQIPGLDTTTIEVTTPSGTIQGPMMSVRTSQPQVFLSNVAGQNSTLPQAAAINEDGTLNSAANPAELGSIVSVWATGAGLLATDSGLPFLPVSLLGAQRVRAEERLSYSLEVLYGAQAPGMVTGVIQINFRLPRPGSFIIEALQLQVGDALSGFFSVYTKE